MSNSESRSVKQCTYTPISFISNNNESDRDADSIQLSKPKKPFEKKAILDIAFDDCDLLNPILDRLKRRRIYRKAVPNWKNIITAVEKINSGDIKSAAQILGKIDEKEIADFAKEVIDAESDIAREAVKDISKVINDSIRTESDLISNANNSVSALQSEQSIKNTSIINSNIKTLQNSNCNTLLSFNSIYPKLAQKSVTSAIVYKKFRTSILLSNTYSSNIKSTGMLTIDEIPESQSEELIRGISEKTESKLEAIQGILDSFYFQPVGCLHLERLNFTPIGYERGELVYSLPLLPGETTRLTHREWSRTEKEFSKIIATSLETSTQDMLSEKTEMAQSFQTQQRHDENFKASVSASAGYGPVSIKAEVSKNINDSESESRSFTASRAKEITHSASSRAKQEHKISFRITSEYEEENESFREISNPNEHAVRWDFHRLMKKWKIDLYRYGIRLTYDLVIPEPASYLLQKYWELKLIEEELMRPNAIYNITPSDIDHYTWRGLETKFGASLDPPPMAEIIRIFHKEQKFEENSKQVTAYDYLPLELPEGYRFIEYDAQGTVLKSLEIIWTRAIEELNLDDVVTPIKGYIDPEQAFNESQLRSGAGKNNIFEWRYKYDWKETAAPTIGDILSIQVMVKGELTKQAMEKWQREAYRILFDASQTQYESKRNALQQRKDQLNFELNSEDSLYLRKFEKQSIMRAILEWMLGPDFKLYPEELPDIFEAEVPYNGPIQDYFRFLNTKEYINLFDYLLETGNRAFSAKYGDFIRFIHQAIEWENMNYVLYPSFWTAPSRRNFIQSIVHDDETHRDFLRAGAARIVLTIRPGFEKAFLKFIETGDTKVPDEDVPYMTIAEEIKAKAETSYPYTPRAQEENPDNLVDTWYEYTPTGALDVSEGNAIKE